MTRGAILDNPANRLTPGRWVVRFRGHFPVLLSWCWVAARSCLGAGVSRPTMDKAKASKVRSFSLDYRDFHTRPSTAPDDCRKLSPCAPGGLGGVATAK